MPSMALVAGEELQAAYGLPWGTGLLGACVGGRGGSGQGGAEFREDFGTEVGRWHHVRVCREPFGCL